MDSYVPSDRPWYINAIAANGEIAETMSYTDMITGEIVLIYSVCIFDDDGGRLGVVGQRQRIGLLGKSVVKTALARDGYGMLLCEDLIVLAHPNADFVGRHLSDPILPISIFADELYKTDDIFERTLLNNNNEKAVVFFRRAPNGWYMGLVTPRGPYYESVTHMALTLSILGLAFAAALSIVLVRVDAAKKKSDIENRHKSAFLANMSHEIRTPINAIIGMTSIGKSAENLERKDYCFRKIENASNHLTGVINDILDMSKIEANKFELSSYEFNFEKLLQNVVNFMNFRIDEKQQKLTVHIDNTIPKTLIGDEHRLAQVITNLLGNAVKFTPENGSIKIDTCFLGKENGNCTIQVSVTDTGIGISREHYKRLFQSFEQAESSTTRKYGGTGLGLAICKKIVEMMGGKIWVNSEFEKGSSFAFTFQAKQGAVQKQKTFTPNGNLNEIRILAIDDDPETLALFTEIAQDLNVSCDTAVSREDALALVEQKGPYHIYFAAWKLSDMNGMELASKLKTRAPAESAVIIISIVEGDVIAEEAKNAVVDKFIQKPLFPSTIADAINASLGLDKLNAEKTQTSSAGLFEGQRILLVEDVDINREIVLSVLESTQLEIDCAENGAEAVSMFSKTPEKYDLIFMDIQMPEMDGYEATRHIRAFEEKLVDKNSSPANRNSEAPVRRKRIPIIAMTANAFQEDIEKCFQAGMNSHLSKPLNIDEVMNTLRIHLPQRYEDKTTLLAS
jgi:signal transduction histidine kinase/DNA-binding response OmpR family regulator